MANWRMLPLLDEDNRAFWTGGADGHLHVQCCAGCGTFLHPPRGVCYACLSDDISTCAVIGDGAIDSFTVNYMAWHEGMEPPFVIARVSLDHAPGVILTTNIVGSSPDQVAVGQRVRVVFERHEDIFIPLFEVIDHGF